MSGNRAPTAGPAGLLCTWGQVIKSLPSASLRSAGPLLGAKFAHTRAKNHPGKAAAPGH